MVSAMDTRKPETTRRESWGRDCALMVPVTQALIAEEDSQALR